MSDRACQSCGMFIKHPSQYHPFAMCALVKQVGSLSAIANLRAVVEYGVQAERAGVDSWAAMEDTRLVRMFTPAEPIDEEARYDAEQALQEEAECE